MKGRPVFLFGESLGGYLSVPLGLRRREVRALSEISGGLPVGYAIDKPRSVSVLISHGTDDTLVPAQNAEDLKRYSLGHHLKVEMNLSPEVGHYLPRTRGEVHRSDSRIFPESSPRRLIFAGGRACLAEGCHFHQE